MNLRDMKCDHLVDLRSADEFSHWEERNQPSTFGGYDVPADPKTLALLEQRMADVDAELARRGLADDGHTILDRAAYEVWEAEWDAAALAKGSVAPARGVYVAVVEPPKHGSVQIEGGEVVYTPAGLAATVANVPRQRFGPDQRLGLKLMAGGLVPVLFAPVQFALSRVSLVEGLRASFMEGATALGVALILGVSFVLVGAFLFLFPSPNLKGPPVGEAGAGKLKPGVRGEARH